MPHGATSTRCRTSKPPNPCWPQPPNAHDAGTTPGTHFAWGPHRRVRAVSRHAVLHRFSTRVRGGPEAPPRVRAGAGRKRTLASGAHVGVGVVLQAPAAGAVCAAPERLAYEGRILTIPT